MEDIERGAAKIKVYLLNGEITVLHGDTGEVLLERKAYKGDWDRIWAALDYDVTKYHTLPVETE